jgi:hypothetical protein
VGRLEIAFLLASAVLQGAVAYFLMQGWSHQSDLFRRVRWFLGGLRGTDWLVAGTGLALGMCLLWVMNLLPAALFGGLLGLQVAVLVRVGLDRRVEQDRAVPLAACQDLLRRMRFQGVDEENLRLFVARHAGRDWEEFFEAVFGLEAKLAARAAVWRAARGELLPTFGSWREPLLEWLNRLDRRRQEGRERDLLARVERARLLATGVDERAAWRRANTAADALVRRANKFRDATGNGSASTLGAILGRSSSVQESPPRRSWRVILLESLLGTVSRAMLTGILLAAFLIWVYQNGLFADPALLRQGNGGTPRNLTPLVIAGLPTTWTDWCDGSHVGWGGILLLGSLFYRGSTMACFVWAGVGITLFGPRLGMSGTPPLDGPVLAMMIGTMTAVIGFRLAESET